MNIKKLVVFTLLLLCILIKTFSEQVSSLSDSKSDGKSWNEGDKRFSLPSVTVFGESERDLAPVSIKFLPSLEKSSFLYLGLNNYYAVSEKSPIYIDKSFSLPDFYNTGVWGKNNSSVRITGNDVRNMKNRKLSYGLFFSSFDSFHSEINFSYPVIDESYREYDVVYQNWANSNFSKNYNEIFLKMQGESGENSTISYLIGIKPLLYIDHSDPIAPNNLGGLEGLGYWGINKASFGFSTLMDIISLSRAKEGNIFLYTRTAFDSVKLWLNPSLTLYAFVNFSNVLFAPDNLIGGEFVFHYGALSIGGALDHTGNDLIFYPIIKLRHHFDEGWKVDVFWHYFNYLNRDAIGKSIVESIGSLPDIYVDRGMNLGISLTIDSGLWNGSLFDLGYLWGDFLGLNQRDIGIFDGRLDVNFKNSPLSKIVFSGRLQIPIIPMSVFDCGSMAYRFYVGYLYDFHKLPLKAIIGGGVNNNVFYSEDFSNLFGAGINTLGISVRLMGKITDLYNYTIGVRGGLKEFKDFFCTLSLGLRYNR